CWRRRRFDRFQRLRRFRLNKFQHAVHQRQGFAWRLRIPRARRLERPVEIFDVEPGERARALDDAIVPQTRYLNVERTLQALIDRLYPEPGHSPLSADPEDVAMQGHR